MEVRLIPRGEMKKYKTYLSMRRFIEDDLRHTMIYSGFDDKGEELCRALINTHGMTASLKYISVNESYRRQGLGISLLTNILFDAKDRGYLDFDMEFLESEAPGMAELSKKLGMVSEDSGRVFYETELSALKKILLQHARLDEMEKLGIYAIERLSEEQLFKLSEKIEESENAPAFDPVFSMGLERSISLVHLDDGQPDATILFERDEKGLYISFMWIDTGHVTLMEKLFRVAYTLAYEKYGANTKLSMAVVNDRLNKIIREELEIDGEHEKYVEYDLNHLNKYTGEVI